MRFTFARVVQQKCNENALLLVQIMAQYYEVLSQSDKTSEQQFYNNVEDQTVQYVISPDKTQTQYPTQQVRII